LFGRLLPQNTTFPDPHLFFGRFFSVLQMQRGKGAEEAGRTLYMLYRARRTHATSIPSMQASSPQIPHESDGRYLLTDIGLLPSLLEEACSEKQHPIAVSVLERGILPLRVCRGKDQEEAGRYLYPQDHTNFPHESG
jgi:hypothetical protein